MIEAFFDPTKAMKMDTEARAILVLPNNLPKVLPNHGWGAPEEGSIEINIDGGLAFDAWK
jgi:hypothetical protein